MIDNSRDRIEADRIKRAEGSVVQGSFQGEVPSPRPDMSKVVPIFYGTKGLIFPTNGKHGGKYGADGMVYVDTFRKIVAFFDVDK